MEEAKIDKIFTVTELSSVIKSMLEGVLGDVQIEGEVSGLKRAASGHIYFDLKDEDSLVAAVLFKGFAFRAPKLENGMKVLVRGEITSFAKQSKYQIIVKAVTAGAAGDLFKKFEELKRKLEEEGLFSEEKKRKIPAFPSRIGVVTSPAGAALRDIISVIRRRLPSAEVILAPALVQGEAAAGQIAAAIENLNKLSPQPDVLLVGRGGGSMEDLWCFNEEIVARAIYNSEVPVISCVGHETDFTIADFAADLRAATPSAAAEVVTQNAEDTLRNIRRILKRMALALDASVMRAEYRLNAALSGGFLKDPALYINTKEQELDELIYKLEKNFEHKVKLAIGRVALLKEKITALGPAGVLKRGYSIVRKSGVIVRAAADAAPGDALEILTAKGNISAKVEK